MENNIINYQKKTLNQTFDLKLFVGICIIFLSIKFSFLFFISLFVRVFAVLTFGFAW